MIAILPYFELNPLCRKGVRSRCRLKHMISWGAIWLTLATFVFLVTYTTMVEQEVSTKAEAAKAALPGILIIQAVILMFFGTGAVASGVSAERDEGLLDYVRMTPMSPTSKVLGYLFGLPAREYLLFIGTLPLVGIIVLISGFSLLTLGHFYLVFFTSVLVYHMTALVVGMVSPKPRLASMMSMGLVVLLYFALSNLSRIGITFFEFLTIRPTFLGLLQQELPESLRLSIEANGIDTFRPVPFFAGTIRPTVYTLLVQGFLIAVMFSIVHRKWRDQRNQLFSKAGALVVFSGVSIFTFASLWAIVAQDDAYTRLFDPFGYSSASGRIPETLFFLLMTCLMIVGGAYLFLICAVTPSKDCTLAGFHQARKAGRVRLGLNSDAASSLPVAILMITMMLGMGIAIMSLAIRHGDYFTSAPSFASAAAVTVLLCSIGLFIQGAAESTSLRVFGVSVFLIWMIPLFTMIIMFAAFEAFEAGFYIGQPFPPVSLGFSIAWMLETTAAPSTYTDGFRFLPSDRQMVLHPSMIAYTGALGYALVAVFVQGLRLRQRRVLSHL
jgi:hypothetical protein